MRNRRILCAAVLAAVLLSSCGGKAGIEGMLADAPDAEVVVALLDVNRFEVLDTVKTDAHGRYSCKVDLKEGQPEFIYLFHGSTRIGSLLLSRGDKVRVQSDTLGN